ncbi:MAG: hypothetical protein PVH59_14710 [Anaerolineae bacterium]|jgi:hypothetical protein
MATKKMFPDQVIREWIESTEDAIAELQCWLGNLQTWANLGCENAPGDFRAAFDWLYQAGLGDTWADTNPAGGGLDRLAEVVTGKEA